MLFFLQKPPTNTQNVYMKYISYVSSQKMAIDCNLYLRCEQKF